jgi:proton-translocating NADH-quinone oxidoreductase chain N
MNLPPFVWLIVWLIASAPVVYLAGRADAAARLRHGLARWMALACLVAAWFGFSRVVAAGTPATWSLGAISLQFDGLSLLLAAVVLTLTTLVVFYSGQIMAGALSVEKYYVLLLILCGVIIGLGCAADLFNLWLWFEAMAIASYPLVAFDGRDRLSLEAGVKYLVQSATGSALILIGIALVLLSAGTLDIAEISAALSTGPLSTLWMAAGILFVIGFGIKVALVPLHTWLPDAHAQAPSGISAMLSAVVIEAGLIAMLRALSALSGATSTWGTALIIFGAANMLIGNLMALRQKQVKRLFAFSSVSHVGYMVTGLGLALALGTTASAQAGFFHLLSHGLMKGLAFLAAGVFLFVFQQQAVGHAQQAHHSLVVEDLNGAARRYPVLALAFSLAVLGLAGLPPLVGFMSKWQILISGAQTQNLLVLLVMAFLALNSVLSLGYYAPLLNRLYRNEPSKAVVAGRSVSLTMAAPLVLLALAVVVLGLYPDLVSGLTSSAASDLMSAFGR